MLPVTGLDSVCKGKGCVFSFGVLSCTNSGAKGYAGVFLAKTRPDTAI